MSIRNIEELRECGIEAKLELNRLGFRIFEPHEDVDYLIDTLHLVDDYN